LVFIYLLLIYIIILIFKDIENDIIGKSDMVPLNVSENKSLLEQLLIDIPSDTEAAKKSAVTTRSTRSHRY